jgi:hypothetical protein
VPVQDLEQSIWIKLRHCAFLSSGSASTLARSVEHARATESTTLSGGSPRIHGVTCPSVTPSRLASAAATTRTSLLRRGCHKMNDGCMAGADEARCKHGEVADWCGESECMAARKGLPARVWRTSQGQVYHRGPACEALLDGQRLAGQFGRGTSEPPPASKSTATQGSGVFRAYRVLPGMRVMG